MTRTRSIWHGMKKRCYLPTDTSFHRYGGIGIRVCDRWRDSFAAFLADMGECPDGMSIDRINSAGDYEPRNCRWATRAQQNVNRRCTIWVNFFGVSIPIKHACKLAGIGQSNVISYGKYHGLDTVSAFYEFIANIGTGATWHDARARIVIDGESVSLKRACEMFGLKYKRVHNRINKHGWDLDRALQPRPAACVCHFAKKG